KRTPGTDEAEWKALIDLRDTTTALRNAYRHRDESVDDLRNQLLTWLNLVRRLGQLFGEFTDVSGQVGLCMEGLACDFDGKRPVF
ncbi:hypothetical protein I4J35_14115, partial [Corynebacterium belfantii]|uniref:hypothetical protein n=1 Tax=Corynebacterium belfantii TaxID=2014537 RepID=UPI0018D2F77F